MPETRRFDLTQILALLILLTVGIGIVYQLTVIAQKRDGGAPHYVHVIDTSGHDVWCITAAYTTTCDWADQSKAK